MPLRPETTFPQIKPPTVRLYLGDLVRLHEIAQPHLKSAQYKANGFAASLPGELAELREHIGKSTIKELQIEWNFERGFLRIKLGSYNAIFGSEEPEVISVAIQAVELLKSRKRPWASQILTNTSWGMGVLMFTAMVMLSAAPSGEQLAGVSKGAMWRFLATFFGYVVLAFAAAYHLNGPRIHLYQRSQEEGLVKWADYKA